MHLCPDASAPCTLRASLIPNSVLTRNVFTRDHSDECLRLGGRSPARHSIAFYEHAKQDQCADDSTDGQHFRNRFCSSMTQSADRRYSAWVPGKEPSFFFQKKKRKKDRGKKLVGIKGRKRGQYDAPSHTFVRGETKVLRQACIFSNKWDRLWGDCAFFVFISHWPYIPRLSWRSKNIRSSGGASFAVPNALWYDMITMSCL